MRKRRIGEHAIGNEPVARAALPPVEIVANDAKVVFGYVSEHRAAGAFAQSPHIRRSSLQALVDANNPPVGELDAGLVEADSRGVRNASGRDEDVAALDG